MRDKASEREIEGRRSDWQWSKCAGNGQKCWWWSKMAVAEDGWRWCGWRLELEKRVKRNILVEVYLD